MRGSAKPLPQASHCEGLSFVSGTRYIAMMLTLTLVRSRSSGRSSFHCADAQVLQAFEQLAHGMTPTDPRSQG